MFFYVNAPYIGISVRVSLPSTLSFGHDLAWKPAPLSRSRHKVHIPLSVAQQCHTTSLCPTGIVLSLFLYGMLALRYFPGFVVRVL